MNLNQVTIYTSKPMETAEFYEKLGLKIIVNPSPGMAAMSVRMVYLLCRSIHRIKSYHLHLSFFISNAMI